MKSMAKPAKKRPAPDPEIKPEVWEKARNKANRLLNDQIWQRDLRLHHAKERRKTNEALERRRNA